MRTCKVWSSSEQPGYNVVVTDEAKGHRYTLAPIPLEWREYDPGERGPATLVLPMENIPEYITLLRSVADELSRLSNIAAPPVPSRQDVDLHLADLRKIVFQLLKDD